MAEEKEDCLQTYWKVIEFLKRNEVKGGWQNLIIRSVDLTTKLGEIIYQCEKMQNKEKKTIRPEDNKILRAFSYAEPRDIKVVIIGTSPAATQSIANGLAFSSDRYESTLKPKQAIPKVHQALRKAKILAEDGDYYCGHEEWARKGVLLLNAALTITEAEKENADDIKSHCDMWNEFLQELLFEWIIKTSIGYRHTLFVMLWGAAPLPNMINYAESVWSKVYKHHKLFKVVFMRKICTFSTDHPTFPSRGPNNFLVKAPGHFEKINDEHRGIFYLKPKVSVDKLTEETKKLSLDNKSDI